MDKSQVLGVSIASDFTWWNDEQVQKISKLYYKKLDNSDYYRYLWFDYENNKCYSLEFSV